MTARCVEAIRLPASGQIDDWDADHPGFGLRVSSRGRKAWVAMYRHGNVKRRLTIGTYPALSLAEAREKAAVAHHAVQYSGTDPAVAKKAERTAETFAELAQTGIVLDVLVQRRRDRQAAKRLLRKLLKKQMRPPRVMITDKLASYGAAKREVMPGIEHRQHKGLNIRGR